MWLRVTMPMSRVGWLRITNSALAPTLKIGRGEDSDERKQITKGEDPLTICIRLRRQKMPKDRSRAALRACSRTDQQKSTGETGSPSALRFTQSAEGLFRLAEHDFQRHLFAAAKDDDRNLFARFESAQGEIKIVEAGDFAVADFDDVVARL